MQIEHRIQIATQPEVIFRLYEDVANWRIWDPDTKQAVLDGPLRVGAKGRLTPTKGMAVPMLITAFAGRQHGAGHGHDVVIDAEKGREGLWLEHVQK